MNHLTIWVPNFDLYPWWLRMWGRLEIRMLWGDQQGAWTSHHSETVIQMMMSIMINNMMIMMMMVMVVVMMMMVMMVMMVIKIRFGAIPVFCCCLVFWPHTTLGQGTFALYTQQLLNLPEESVGRCHGQPADAHQEQLHARRAKSASLRDGNLPSELIFQHGFKVKVFSLN